MVPRCEKGGVEDGCQEECRGAGVMLRTQKTLPATTHQRLPNPHWHGGALRLPLRQVLVCAMHFTLESRREAVVQSHAQVNVLNEFLPEGHYLKGNAR